IRHGHWAGILRTRGPVRIGRLYRVPEIQALCTCHLLYDQAIYQLILKIMKTPYQNIYTILRINRLIVFTVVICAFMASTFSLWTAYTTYKNALNSAFAINTDG